MDLAVLIVILAVAVVVAMFLAATVKVIRQQQIGVVERLGKFHRTLEPGPHLVIPVFDRVRYTLDMREAVVPFPPQGVITEDNLMVGIDSVIYYQILDARRAAYEAQDYIKAIEQLTMTTLRNIIGGLDLEQTLTSREEINQKLRVVLDEATGKWGIKVNRVELRAIDPPATIRDAMEKGARAERDKRASILIAEGQRQSQILAAGGEKESSILRAQGDREAAVLRAQADRQAQMLRAEGEAQAISTVFNAIHAGEPDQALLSYQYMQMLPTLARGDSNKLWIVPSEIGKALEGLGGSLGSLTEAFGGSDAPAADKRKFRAPEKVDVQAEITQQAKEDAAESERIVQAAIAEAQELERTGRSKPATLATPEAQRGIGTGAQPEPEPASPSEPAGQPDPHPVADDQPGPEFTQADGPSLR
jgi:regulator of protease activity HflC (stomatin/prohibitin superfamily)